MKNLKVPIILILIILLFNCSKVEAIDLEPLIKGDAAITIDINTKEIIYSKNIDKRLYPASTTKLVTSMLLEKNKKVSDVLTYSKAAKAQEAVKLDLPVNEKVTASNAMDSMLLDSANDIAYMVGENLGGTIPKFADMMNSFISSLNLHNTHFVTPNGLPNVNHYTTAYDLSVIGREALNYPWVSSTLSKKKASFKTSGNVTINLKNTNKLLGTDGCIGGKTGYTDASGRCFVAMYERNGRKIIGVILKSEMDTKDTIVFDEMKRIIDYSYAIEKTIVVKSNTTIKTLKLNYKIIPYIGPSRTIDVPLFTQSDISYYSNDINSSKLSYNIYNINVWKLRADQTLGNVSMSQREVTEKLPLYSSISIRDILSQNMRFYVIVTIFLLAIIRILQFFILKAMKKKKKNKRNHWR